MAGLFHVLVDDIELYASGRESFEIDYELLGRGNMKETRFVLGKVIMDAMCSGVVQEHQETAVEKHHLQPSDSEKELRDVKEERVLHLEQQQNRKRKEFNGLKPVSDLKQSQVVVKKRKGVSELADQEEQREPEKKPNLEQQQKVIEKKDKCQESVSNLKQQQEVVEKKVKLHKPLSSFFL